jgi:putative membrane protein
LIYIKMRKPVPFNLSLVEVRQTRSETMMCGWWDGAWLSGSGVPWYGMIFGPIMMIGFVALAVLAIVWLLRIFGLAWQQGHSALDILKERFARGEIDRTEYEDRKRLVIGS